MDSPKKGEISTARKIQVRPRADAPFEAFERINDNAYKVKLPRDYGVSTTFSMVDLSSYLYDE